MSIQNESASKHSLMKGKNMRLLIERFRNDTFSTFRVGKQIGLSTGGAKKLVDEIVEGGLLVRVPPVRLYAQGRTPLNYALNKDYGSILIVNYAEFAVTLRDLTGTVIASAPMPVGRIENEHIYKTAQIMRDMLAAHPACKLMAISIAFVGRINKKTCSYFSGQFCSCSIDLEQYFRGEFGVDVIIENDLNFALLAERRGGVISELSKDNHVVCLLSIGRGVACSIMIEDKLYTGANGIAGEIGHNSNLGEPLGRSVESFIQWDTIRDTISARQAAGEKTGLPPDFTFADAVAAYQAGDSLVCDVVDGTTVYVAQLIGNMVLFMDFDIIILSGLVVAFGDRYVENVRAALKKILQAHNNYLQTDIIVSRGGEDLIEYGAFEAARDVVFERFIEMCVNKETNNKEEGKQSI